MRWFQELVRASPEAVMVGLFLAGLIVHAAGDGVRFVWRAGRRFRGRQRLVATAWPRRIT